MGRRKGSLNKKNKAIIKFKKKRDRLTKKVVKEVLPLSNVSNLSNVKIYKFLGYCPKCKAIIGRGDLETKFIFSCPSCGKRARINR